jgi:hypothetical protein
MEKLVAVPEEIFLDTNSIVEFRQAQENISFYLNKKIPVSLARSKSYHYLRLQYIWKIFFRRLKMLKPGWINV